VRVLLATSIQKQGRRLVSKIKVDLIDHMGSDLSVVNAARVSFDKASEWETVPYRHGMCQSDIGWEDVLSDKDTKLIHYLAKHNHWSPFAHCFLSFRIKAPIFVARQLQKHQVGLAWNEVSRRYVDTEPEFYVPDGWRKRAENVKQGSSDETVNHVILDAAYRTRMEECLVTYQTMIERGVCPEQARMVLPQSMMTEWIWSGSLYAFARVCKLRLDPHTQKETQGVAEEIARLAREKFPVSWHSLMLT
jgi:thymidylate synthase (FAD)